MRPPLEKLKTAKTRGNFHTCLLKYMTNFQRIPEDFFDGHVLLLQAQRLHCPLAGVLTHTPCVPIILQNHTWDIFGRNVCSVWGQLSQHVCFLEITRMDALWRPAMTLLGQCSPDSHECLIHKIWLRSLTRCVRWLALAM
jgi:hypothetical protein